ncbi:glutathione ABC transporter substrate-binding protein [Pseudothermotoga sp.]|uniref:glutathione ABC transporter substrate-binding protein n=1 Tax=Pseudothermotoga sp. TaxID=2033661 RepID=UPI0031F6870C
MRRFVVLLFVFLCVAIFAAKYGGTFRFLIGVDVTTLLPGNIPDSISTIVGMHIFEGLVDIDENLKIIPALAERWEITDNGTAYVFHLRKNVKFHDGVDFNAHAVKKNFDYLFSANLRNVGVFKGIIKEVQVLDDFTVKIVLFRPHSAILYRLAQSTGWFVSPQMIDKFGQDTAVLSRNPVGTGPFMFKEWKAGESVELVKNPNYWRQGLPYLDRIIFKVVAEDVSRVNQVRAGDADLMYNPPPALVTAIEQDKSLQIKIIPTVRTIFIGLNTSRAPLNDVRVRQALNYAVDKEKLCKVLMRGLAKPSDSPLSSMTYGYFSTGGYPYNPQKAKQLLKEAGYENLKLELITPKGRYLNDYETAVAIQGMLKEVGINVDVKPMEWGSYVAKILSQKPEDWDYQMFLLGWAPGTAEGYQVLFPLFHSSNRMGSPTGTMRYNNYFYSNPKVDELIEKAAVEIDEKKLLEYFAEAQKLVVQDAPWIFLYEMNIAAVMRKEVQGVKLYPTERVSLAEAWIDR